MNHYDPSAKAPAVQPVSAVQVAFKRPDFLAWLYKQVHIVRRRLARSAAMRRQRRELERLAPLMDDRMLKDIGLTRHDFYREMLRVPDDLLDADAIEPVARNRAADHRGATSLPLPFRQPK